MTTLCKGRFLSLEKTGDWEYCTRHNAHCVVTIVAINDSGELLLTEQFRPPLNSAVIELPAGLVGDDPEQPDERRSDAAGRELEEECGYRAGALSELTHGPISAGLTDEVVHFYRAWDLEQTGDGGGVAGEDITVHAVPLDQVPDWLADCSKRGLLVDPKVWTGLYFLTIES